MSRASSATSWSRPWRTVPRRRPISRRSSSPARPGTARRTQYGAGYGRNEYTASFVGLFPGRDPQYVILVKLDDPDKQLLRRDDGRTCSRSILQAAIAARDAALDRTVLANSRRVSLVDAPCCRGGRSGIPRPTGLDSALATTSTLVTLGSKLGAAALAASAPVPIPDVRGWTLRSAVRALHRAGLRVEIVSGALGSTIPVAGTVVESSDTSCDSGTGRDRRNAVAR